MTAAERRVQRLRDGTSSADGERRSPTLDALPTAPSSRHGRAFRRGGFGERPACLSVTVRNAAKGTTSKGVREYRFHFEADRIR